MRRLRLRDNYAQRERWTEVRAIHFDLDIYTFRRLIRVGYSMMEIEK
jgi:hypothetical protein